MEVDKRDIIREEMNNLVFVDSYWFRYGGVVLCQDQITLEYKAYMSGIKIIDRDIQEDVREIMSFGEKVPVPVMKAFFPGIIFDETKEWFQNNPEYML